MSNGREVRDERLRGDDSDAVVKPVENPELPDLNGNGNSHPHRALNHPGHDREGCGDCASGRVLRPYENLGANTQH